MLTGIELVNAAHPLETGIGKVVKGNQVVVAWHAMDRANTNLVQSGEEIRRDIDRLLERLGPDINSSHGRG